MTTKPLQKTFLKAEFNDILGQNAIKDDVKSALSAGRHIILVGAPGIGKTTLAKNIAKTLPTLELNDCGYNCLPDKPICPNCTTNKKTQTKKNNPLNRFIRIQGSPDLTAEDLIGDIDPIKALKYGPLSIEAFTPGKIFKANNGVLFFDELNRCNEKLQNTLLQVLEEGKATIGSYNLDFTADFIFVGTMNPEDSSTEPLSDVLLDRFDMIYVQYPESLEIEQQIVHQHGLKAIDFPEKILVRVLTFIRNLRAHPDVEKKPSVRASLGLYERAQTHAILQGKKIVEMEDVLAVLVSVLAHRIRLKHSVKYLKSPENFIQAEFESFIADTGGYL
ncbi:AAA family ATPase [Candidatus Woesearchaeota archaeon]|nr:AAA family ATPase [Candidatus Woesearchaeota archaeon]